MDKVIAFQASSLLILVALQDDVYIIDEKQHIFFPFVLDIGFVIEFKNVGGVLCNVKVEIFQNRKSNAISSQSRVFDVYDLGFYGKGKVQTY
jgi:hypothetical protein